MSREGPNVSNASWAAWVLREVDQEVDQEVEPQEDSQGLQEEPQAVERIRKDAAMALSLSSGVR